MELVKDSMEGLLRFASEISFAAGATIIRRGEEGRAFFVIASGEVEVRIAGEGGDPLTLNRLSQGNFFGEISLLTATPVTADVVAASPVQALVCSRDDFFSVLDDSRSFANDISRVLASRLASNTDDIMSLHLQRKALNSLMGAGARAQPLFALSPAMEAVEDFVGSPACRRAKAILVHGGAGAGKVFAASLMHRARCGESAPFVVVDCRSFCCEELGSILFGPGSGHRRRTCTDAAEGQGSFGALHLADQGTLVLKHVDALGIPFQGALLDHLDWIRSDAGSLPLQLIATTRKTPEELEEGGLLHPRLAALVENAALPVPNLVERRRDILPLAVYFLQRCEGHGAFSFTAGAEKKLLSSDYGHRNVTELKEAVETATQVSEGVEIGEEHLFLGSREGGAALEFAAARSPLLRRLTGNAGVASIRAFILAAFCAVMGAGIVRAGFPESRLANTLIWSLWEPLLFASFFILGRVWCTVCPLSTAGKILGRLKSLDRPPPEWLKRNSGIILVSGFAAIIWAEHYFVMPANPFPSGMLLLLLFAAAGLFAILYQRETWCRYACPLGGLGAALGIPAVLTVKANRHICANYCSTHECFKGTETSSGCPNFRHPLQGTEATSCKLCLACIGNCPHGAARLYLRPPLRAVWQIGDTGEATVLFGFFLFFFGPAMLASQGGTWASTDAGFGLTTLSSILLALIARRRVPDLLQGYTASHTVLLSRVSQALVVLAWGPAMAYQMHHIPVLSGFVLHARAGAPAFLHPREVSLLFLVQAFFIFLAAVLAVICFWRVRLEASTFLYTTWDLGWKFLALVCALYVALNLLLILPGVP